MPLFNIFRRGTKSSDKLGSGSEKVTTYNIFAGGSGGEIGALNVLMAPGEALYSKLCGAPRLNNPETCLADMDAEAKGLEKASVIEDKLNVLASCDTDGTAFGYYKVVNASISTHLDGAKGEKTSISDMIPPEDIASRRLMNAVLTRQEAELPREVGGQGKPKLVELWQNSVMKVDTMQSIVDNILKAYIDGRKILVRITGSATGATGATLLKTLSYHIYRQCKAANASLIDNLRIHSIVVMGYAVHPGEFENSAFALDSTEDDFKALNWFRERADSGMDRVVNRTYFVNAKPSVCCELFARGGNQGRHYCLGDMLCLAAIKDGDATAFDSSYDGCRVFVPASSDDARFGWSNLSDSDLKKRYINYARFCAAVWLKLRPLTLVSHEEARVAPHAVKLLGKNAPSDRLEEEVIKPIEAMIGIAGDALRAFMEIGASGTDFSRDIITYTTDDTTLFNPYVIRKILEGEIDDYDVNDFDPDALTEYTKGNGTANVIETSETIGSAYNRAVNEIGKNDTAIDFMFELYRALSI